MSESDLQLKKSKESQKEADRKYKEASMIMEIADRHFKKNEQKEKQLVAREKSFDSIVKNKVSQQTEKEMSRLENKYHIWITALLGYGIVFTLLGIFNNRILQGDLKELHKCIADKFYVLVDAGMAIADGIGNVTCIIDNGTIATVVYWLIMIAIVIGAGIGLYILSNYLIRIIFRIIRKRLWDRYSGAVILAVWTIVVNLGAIIKRIVNVNLILFGIIVLIVYGVVRLIVTAEDKIRRNTVLIYLAGAMSVIGISYVLIKF